jgi:hypothetical protein
MNKTEARQMMMKHLMPSIEKFGYKEKKGGAEFEIDRKIQYGLDRIVGGFSDYNPVQKIVFSVLKRDNRILDILTRLVKEGVVLSVPISKTTGTIGFGYESLNEIQTIGILPEMSNEDEVATAVSSMVDFLVGTAFPLLDRFNDLKEIDKEINGVAPWRTDWQQPYTFGLLFNEIRLIVARLTGNPNYYELIDFTYRSIEELSAESGYPFTYDRNDLSKSLPGLIKLLETVEPI